MNKESRIKEWIQEIDKINQSRNLPHASNLLRKLSLSDSKKESWFNAFEIIIPNYLLFHSTKIENSGSSPSPYFNLVSSVNRYLKVLRSPDCNVFSHQSDFSSSVIPEFFYVLFHSLVEKLNLKYEVSAQRDLVIECMFDGFEDGRLIPKKKRIDVSIYIPAKFELNSTKYDDFCIPLIAMEIKTNMDKNMISGIEHAVESLKRTFPQCLYFAICEFADFAVEKQNYATTLIDEIVILRKQKRSKIRKGQPVQKIDYELIDYLSNLVIKHLRFTTNPIVSLKDRMNKGRLISREQ